MNIPSQIKVGARTYNVIELDEGAGVQSDIVGQIDYRAQTIKLLYAASHQAMEQSLLHEIVHALAFDMGYTTDHDEREIDLLANELHRLIVDNPALFVPEGAADKEGVPQGRLGLRTRSPQARSCDPATAEGAADKEGAPQGRLELRTRSPQARSCDPATAKGAADVKGGQ